MAVLESRDDTNRLVLCTKTCGRFRITGTATSLLKDPSFEHLRPYLAAYIRQANGAGDAAPRVDETNYRELAESHAHTPISTKLRLLLEYIGRATLRPGRAMASSAAALHPTCDAFDADEVGFLLKTLRDRNDLLGPSNGGWMLSAQGWERLDPVSGGVPGNCFVAMSFRPELDEAFSVGIVPALQECGYRAKRVDRDPHNDNITDRIIAGIRGCQFLVADFTLQRQGVYYEAGFAQGLGRPVVRLCRDSDFDQLHFDTRQFFHLKWSTPADLRESLTVHVLATIGPFRGDGAS